VKEDECVGPVPGDDDDKENAGELDRCDSPLGVPRGERPRRARARLLEAEIREVRNALGMFVAHLIGAVPGASGVEAQCDCDECRRDQGRWN
jgi:hypothetical protein